MTPVTAELISGNRVAEPKISTVLLAPGTAPLFQLPAVVHAVLTVPFQTVWASAGATAITPISPMRENSTDAGTSDLIVEIS